MDFHSNRKIESTRKDLTQGKYIYIAIGDRK